MLNSIYSINTINFLEILLFLVEKPFSKCQRTGNARLPLLDSFRTFCWGEVIEELRKIYKLKELINLPV